jgi:hypothetical protein
LINATIIIQIPAADRAPPERRRLLSFTVRALIPAIINKTAIGTMIKLIGENIRMKINPKITPRTPKIMLERQEALTAFLYR